MEQFKYLLLPLLLLTACHKTETYFPKDMTPVTINIIRFDSALIQMDTTRMNESIKVLYDTYPDMMYQFVENLLGYSTTDTTTLCHVLPTFLSDTNMHFAYINTIEQQTFTDTKPLEQTLSKAFTRIHFLCPDWPIPNLYMFVSGFNCSLFYTDEIIGIGADMYLGSEFPYYNHVAYDYQLPYMDDQYIAADVIVCYLSNNIAYRSSKNRLIDHMIHQGKILFIAQQLLPMEPNYRIIDYTPEQWTWCHKNERRIWNTIMDNRDLYQSDSRVISSYINEGPFTAQVTQSSPGRLGCWVGWQIVNAYMTNHKNITLTELIKENNAEIILQQSLYKP